MNIMEEATKMKGYMNNGYKVGGHGGYGYLHNGKSNGDSGCNFLV